MWTEYIYTKDNKFDISAVRFRSSPWRQGCFEKIVFFSICYTRFSLAHKRQHKNIRTRRMAYLTQFSIPALLNPMVNKMADEASAILLLICQHEVWVKAVYDWFTALCLCLCLCRPTFHLSKLRHGHKHNHRKNELVRFSSAYAYAYVDPVFTCHSYDMGISTSTRRTNLFVFFVLMLYVEPVFTCLHMSLCLCLCLCASENQA